MSPIQHKSESGVVYLLTVVMVALLAGLSMSYLGRVVFLHQTVRADTERERAYRIAEAGLQLALAEVVAEVDLASDGMGRTTGSLDGGSYDVVITPGFESSIEGPWRLRSTGSYGTHRVGVELVLAGGRGVFKHSMFTVEGFESNGGAFADSYDSAAGSYESQAINVHAGTGLSYAHHAGNVATNGDIKLDKGSAIFGDATPGPDGTVTTKNGAVITGSSAPGSQVEAFESFIYSPPIGFTADKVRVDTTLSLGTGTYRYKELDVRGELLIDGDVTIYADKDFKVTGVIDIAESGRLTLLHDRGGNIVVGGAGIVNRSREPGKLRIHDAGSKEFKFDGTSRFYGVLYAPDTQFKPKGGSEFYGAMVVKKVQMTGGSTAFHYDESLGRSRGYKVLIVRDFWPGS